MKVLLSIANVSNIDDLVCDSGIIFQRILMEEFAKRSIQCHILGPNKPQFLSYNFENAVKHVGPLGITRYSSRFNFDWHYFAELINNINPDIIFNNQVEIAAAIRSVLTALNKNNIKLITYCHYPAIWGIEGGNFIIDGSLNYNNLGVPIIFDILSALLTSDWFIVQSQFAKSLILKAAEYYKIKNFKEIQVIPPPLDPLIKKIGKISKRGRSILYNHRLYESYGTSEFIDFIGSCRNLNFELIISDPMPSRSKERSNLNSTPAKFREYLSKLENTTLFDGNVSRESYAKLIQNSRIAIGAFRKACVWSMSSIDCISLGVPVIAQNYGAYSEFIPKELLFEDLLEAKNLIKRLLDDDEYWNYTIDLSEAITRCLEPSMIATKFYDIFGR